MKILTHIDPLTATKVAAVLGVLWALLGWFMNSLVIVFLSQSAPEGLGELPAAFSLGGLLSGIIGGFIGGTISGYFGALVYNLLARKTGGVRIALEDVPMGPPRA